MASLGMELLAPADERLMTLNTVRIPAGVDDAAVRTALRETFNVEIGGGMGPLAGKIWRIGLMGAGATAEHVDVLVAGLETALKRGSASVVGPNGAAEAAPYLRSRITLAAAIPSSSVVTIPSSCCS